MKKIHFVLVAAAMFCLVSLVDKSYAAPVLCSNMKITSATAKVIGSTQNSEIWIENVSGTSSGCAGILAAGAKKGFYLHSSIVDSGLATALTALSLGRLSNLYIEGTTISSISVRWE